MIRIQSQVKKYKKYVNMAIAKKYKPGKNKVQTNCQYIESEAPHKV